MVYNISKNKNLVEGINIIEKSYNWDINDPKGLFDFLEGCNLNAFLCGNVAPLNYSARNHSILYIEISRDIDDGAGIKIYDFSFDYNMLFYECHSYINVGNDNGEYSSNTLTFSTFLSNGSISVSQGLLGVYANGLSFKLYFEN